MPGLLYLAPLRGVTIRVFREAFQTPIREAGFTAAVAPFIPANPGLRVTDKMFAELRAIPGEIPLIPQVITKHPEPLRELLKGFKQAGFQEANLNAGCPFPMIRKRGRGSGLLRTPNLLERLIEVGCEEMGPNHFSLKLRLGLDDPHEILSLMPRINRYPLQFVAVHARTAKQMYEGACQFKAFQEAQCLSENPVVYNGDVPFPVDATQIILQGFGQNPPDGLMIGRNFIRALGWRADVFDSLANYIEYSQAELSGDRPVLGRLKELISYWLDTPFWKKRWSTLKMCHTLEEFRFQIEHGASKTFPVARG